MWTDGLHGCWSSEYHPLIYDIADVYDDLQCGRASPDDDDDCGDRELPNDVVAEGSDAVPSRDFQQCPNCHTQVFHGGACNCMR